MVIINGNSDSRDELFEVFSCVYLNMKLTQSTVEYNHIVFRWLHLGLPRELSMKKQFWKSPVLRAFFPHKNKLQLCFSRHVKYAQKTNRVRKVFLKLKIKRYSKKIILKLSVGISDVQMPKDKEKLESLVKISFKGDYRNSTIVHQIQVLGSLSTHYIFNKTNETIKQWKKWYAVGQTKLSTDSHVPF